MGWEILQWCICEIWSATLSSHVLPKFIFISVSLFTSVFFGLIPESTLVHSTSILELSTTVFSIDQKPKHPLVPTQPSGCHESTWWEK